jgi:hypothetical protein
VKWELAKLIDQVGSVCEIDLVSGCWLWRYGSWASRDYASKREYPRLMIAGERHHVARWVMVAKVGNAPDMEPCHSCDRPECVNPEHLHWGTHQENMLEMGSRNRAGSMRHPERYRGLKKPGSGHRGDDHPFRKNPGLAARGDRHGSKTHPERWARGERTGISKLTDDKVRAIRKRLAAGDVPTVIAPGFGVGRGTIRAIAEGRTWRHVA